MIGRLNPVAIAVRDMAAAAAVYRNTLGGDVTEAVALPDHGVTTVFINLPNTKNNRSPTRREASLRSQSPPIAGGVMVSSPSAPLSTTRSSIGIRPPQKWFTTFSPSS